MDTNPKYNKGDNVYVHSDRAFRQIMSKDKWKHLEEDSIPWNMPSIERLLGKVNVTIQLDSGPLYYIDFIYTCPICGRFYNVCVPFTEPEIMKVENETTPAGEFTLV